MDMQTAIQYVISGKNLAASEMHHVMQLIMTGEATPAQVGGFLIGLRCKGETVEEIAAAAEVMRELAAHVNVTPDHLVDTCGTGGDSSGTFNVSTCFRICRRSSRWQGGQTWQPFHIEQQR